MDSALDMAAESFFGLDGCDQSSADKSAWQPGEGGRDEGPLSIELTGPEDELGVLQLTHHRVVGPVEERAAVVVGAEAAHELSCLHPPHLEQIILPADDGKPAAACDQARTSIDLSVGQHRKPISAF